jgi:hypothetical protein
LYSKRDQVAVRQITSRAWSGDYASGTGHHQSQPDFEPYIGQTKEIGIKYDCSNIGGSLAFLDKPQRIRAEQHFWRQRQAA